MNRKKVLLLASVLFVVGAILLIVYFRQFFRQDDQQGGEDIQRDFEVIVRPTKTLENILEKRPDISEVYEEEDVIEFEDGRFGGYLFDRFEAGKIYYIEDGKTVSRSLTDELLISCTLQSLHQANEFDLNLISKNLIYSRNEVDSQITRGEPIIVVFDRTEQDQAVYRIIVGDEACPVEE